ncbi:TPA: recombinase family protein [Clostridium botulinum]|uniref:recombinase family protein n=1 Tax=Clostridium botulinum TaxID=1491 RepID=UPI00035BA02C|nr:recombinase family protein [Clostridium botulinum]EPS53184.1 putative resolvase [Clostridium botulinum Af84]MBN3360161.1 resolvase [Clostridium botulinum]NFM82639.1 recombinase family protein [Clostridium botulinum]NFP12265.1 recombinase family protein [Clostridium botulinum]NFR29725.1 recombinase family protein [Clostridium botulinum]
MLYGYCRSANGNKESLEKQIEWVKSKGASEKDIYIDIGSGLDPNRVEMNKLLENIKEGDIIFSEDINRITRSKDGLEKIIEFAKTKRVKFILGDEIIDGINGVDKAIEGVLAVLNEFEKYQQDIENSAIDNIEE